MPNTPDQTPKPVTREARILKLLEVLFDCYDECLEDEARAHHRVIKKLVAEDSAETARLREELRGMEFRALDSETKDCVNCDSDGISYSDEQSECSWGCHDKYARLSELRKQEQE